MTTQGDTVWCACAEQLVATVYQQDVLNTSTEHAMDSRMEAVSCAISSQHAGRMQGIVHAYTMPVQPHVRSTGVACKPSVSQASRIKSVFACDQYERQMYKE